MFDYISRLLDTRSLSPHGICLLWRPELLWTHVLSDAFIFLAYMTIPIALAVIIRRRKDVPFSGMIWCFALFITACGFTHFMGIWTLWNPDYGIEALVKAVTAVASVATAILLWSLIPVAVGLPSPARLREMNLTLERRIAERDAAIAALQQEKAERRRAEDALLQAQKMDALGQLTGGIAHDFNNLLQAIQGCFELINQRPGDEAKVKRLAEGGLIAAGRGAHLTGQLLTFSRTRQLKLEPCALADIAAGMSELLARVIGPSIDLRFDLQAAEAVALTDRHQVELAILNLVLNARDAMPGGGRVVIRSERYQAAADADLKPGAYIRVSVIDNGVGMAPEIAARAFDPFFTTKPVGQGTGLGLSQVYGFARQTGGAARIASAEGQGAVVSLFIPEAAEHQPLPPAAKAPPIGAPLPPANVLLVDDDEAVRQAAAETLGALGLEVQQAGGGASALDLAARARPDLVLLDFAMPEMNGAELAQALRRQWPDLKVIFVTGYADPDQLEAVIGPHETVLRKPYRLDELQAALARALEAA